MVKVGIVGAGYIGGVHATLLAKDERVSVPMVHDVLVERAEQLARSTGARIANSIDELIDGVDAVYVATPNTKHTAIAMAAIGGGKHVFCEKPMALTLEDADRAIAAAHNAGVALQVGFNRRFADDFAAMRSKIADGAIGMPQLLRSLTRDPGITADVAARVKPWTIFNETLIHDFDTLCWLNPGARVTQVFAQADALIHPEFRDSGFLDTAVVQLRFDNRAFAVAEASFQAVYGYDVRGEVFGSDGVLLAGRAPDRAATGNTDLFADAYVAQFAHFAECVRMRTEPSVTGNDARVALDIAIAARESVQTGAPVVLNGVLQ